MSVVIETTVGDLTVDLFLDERPVACLNFMKLCKLKYYNFNLFHTVEQGFIAQTGDPIGSGNGGSSVWGLVEGPTKRFFEAENLPKIKHSSPGLLSMVSVGKHLVGSQFFFTLGSDLTSLDGKHCVIGQVVEGQETLRKMNEAIVDDKFRPYQDIRIAHTVILNDPFPDPRGFRVPSRSPSPSADRLQNGRIGADEDIDDTQGKSIEEIQEMLQEREAKARATILEIVGDLPDADMAPPENVLFVCKLNPVTTDDDLEIIFSRFGKVKNCEVIRDKKTGDSLQYAFVEFEKKESCEAAFFKMDNVLIDDRRIHVDFSQSVAKVKWRGKGRGVEGVEGRLDFNNLKGDDRKYVWRQQHRYKIEKKQIGRRHIPIEERRRAREERHRERDQRERNEHHNSSRSRHEEVRNDRQKRSGHEREVYSRHRRDSSSYEVRQDSSGRRRHHERSNSRPTTTNREKGGPPERRNSQERRHRETLLHNKSHKERSPHLSKDKRTESSVKKTNERKKETLKKKPKKKKPAASSSESNSETSSSESSSQSSSSSSSSSTSEDERKKKKHSSTKKSKK